jgi:hypothetical protein
MSLSLKLTVPNEPQSDLILRVGELLIKEPDHFSSAKRAIWRSADGEMAVGSPSSLTAKAVSNH